MKDSISINDFISDGSKHIKSRGILNDCKANIAEIFDVLIRNAAKYCKRHAADILYDWDYLTKLLDAKELDSESMLFGFREDGEDHATYILSRYNSPQTYGDPDEEYKAIYRLDVEVDDKNNWIGLDFYKVKGPKLNGVV